jgi:UDP-N-acetylglucosamine 2-epimerase (non-hydrolysing)
MKSLAIILGTRPEIIKLAPVVRALRKSTMLRPEIIFTGQHQSMAEQAFSAFGITADHTFDLMRPDQTPNSFLGLLLPKLEQTLTGKPFAGVLVQGDTTSALGGALSAFHCKIPLGHVEAGLRTGDVHSPFPEEMNRVLISRIAEQHFCHTEHARMNLQAEGVTENLHVTGNTVIDALRWVVEQLDSGSLHPQAEVAKLPLRGEMLLLVTGHRRENFDAPLLNLCRVLRRLAEELPALDIVYPVHLNPNVQQTVYRELGSQKGVHLIPPVDYPSFAFLMRKTSLIITDSGGIQEEAPSLGKRVLVTRRTTERPEAVELGCSEVFPLHEPDALFSRAQQLLSCPAAPLTANPYGDGTAAKHITALLERCWC